MKYELGIIGGMGSLATVILFDYIVRHTRASSDQEHINTIILNHALLPDRTQIILSGKRQDFLEEIKKDFEVLNNLGVKAIGIPCNTSHYFYDEMKKMTQAHLINMVEETVIHCKNAGVDKVTVFATEGTVQAGVYHKYAEKHGLEIQVPNQEDQDQISQIIYQVKETGKTHYPQIDELIQFYGKDTKVILACTELSTLHIKEENTLDALKVLGNRAIEICERKVII